MFYLLATVNSDVVYKYGCIFNELTLFPLVLRPTVELKNYSIVPVFFLNLFARTFVQLSLCTHLYYNQKCMKAHFSQYLLSLIYIIIANLTEVKCYPVWFWFAFPWSFITLTFLKNVPADLLCASFWDMFIYVLWSA